MLRSYGILPHPVRSGGTPHVLTSLMRALGRGDSNLSLRSNLDEVLG
jgi:hypothetical protein